MSRLSEKLVRLGLTEKQAMVYLASLELGESNIQRIADRAKIKRMTTYDVIDSLVGLGYIGKVAHGKRTNYFAKDPRQLEDKIEERRSILRSTLPELLAMANLMDKKPRIRFF